MAATSGNTHITDGMVFTQAECDEYQVAIDNLQINWNWRTGVNGTYKLKSGTWNGSELINMQEGSGDTLTHTLAGAHEYYPAWRTANPDVTGISGTAGSQSYDQWNKFTNDRSTWDAEAAEIKTDLDKMKATHVEMLATVD
mgnify:CR=1 FL=1